jgi:hypothetical protein
LKEAFSPAGHAKVERAARAGGDCVEHPQRIFSVEFRARISGGMNDIIEFAIREIEINDASAYEGEVWMLGEVRGLLPESVNASRQDRRLESKAKAFFGMAKTLQKPAADEAGAPSDEKASAMKVKKILFGQINHGFEILRECPALSFWRHCF